MPLTLINRFHVHSGNTDAFTRVWPDIATYMERQDGFVSTRFSRSLKDPTEFVNVAVWDDEGSFRKALESEEFQQLSEPLAELASSAPELFETVYAS
ncbi:MAG: antibiotic biosynthesis monooxygenase [Deinococcales bacterium]|jgi:heme-degrading monooxygenase HmoA